MGSSESKPPSPPPSPPPPPPNPLLDRPWRAMDWTVKDELLKDVRKYKPDGASHLRILVYGPVGVGKSSFINTAGTLIVGRNVNVAAACPSNSETSFTVEFKTHQFMMKGSEKRTIPIVFNDLMGLESTGESNRGLLFEDVKLAMKGHVKDGYSFNPTHALSDKNWYYNKSPTINDKVHVLVCMLNASAVEIKSSILNTMKIIREAARDLGIPQVAVVTHIDSICPEINKDIRNVYRSRALKKKMDLLSKQVGIPISNVYAVRNQYEGSDRAAADVLALTILKDVLGYGDDCIDYN